MTGGGDPFNVFRMIVIRDNDMDVVNTRTLSKRSAKNERKGVVHGT